MKLVKLTELPDGDHEFVARCPFSNCKCRIIDSASLLGTKTTIANPPTMLKLSKTIIASEPSTRVTNGSFYQISDVWKFDNIGVSRKIPEEQGDTLINDNPIHIQRLLVCSDCDRGPIGFAGIMRGDNEDDVEKLVYFLHIDSILYDLKDQ